jgi:hypothetical protein
MLKITGINADKWVWCGFHRFKYRGTDRFSTLFWVLWIIVSPVEKAAYSIAKGEMSQFHGAYY